MTDSTTQLSSNSNNYLHHNNHLNENKHETETNSNTANNNNNNVINSKEILPNSLISRSLDPPDGGWGWVIVAASFYCCGIVDGLASVVGVLLPRLVEHFVDSTHSQVALVGSLYAGMFLMSGLVASSLIENLGCRQTTIIGSIISTISILLSTTATNIYVFILFFGVIGGFGIGLIYSPASVMVNYYFLHRRGMANGIACAGAGAGILILSPLADFLSSCYGWKGCLWIVAGLGMQCAVCGALMRPLKVELIQSRNAQGGDVCILNEEEEKDDEDNLGFNEFKCQDGIGYSINGSIHSLENQIKHETFDSLKISNEVFPKLDVIIEKEELKLKENKMVVGGRNLIQDKLIKSYDVSEDRTKWRPTKFFLKQKGNAASLSNSELTTWATIPAESSTLVPPTFESSSPTPSQQPPTFSIFRPPLPNQPSRRNRGISESFITVDNAFVQLLNKKHSEATSSNRLMRSDSRIVVSTVVLNPLNRLDAFYTGSISSLHRILGGSSRNVDAGIRDGTVPGNRDVTQMLSVCSKDGISTALQTSQPHLQQPQSHKNSISSSSQLQLQQQKTGATTQEPNNIPTIFKRNKCFSTLSRFFNIRLFTNVSFLIINISCIFIQLAFFVPILFLADYAQKLGFSANQGALLLSILGGSNMIGRAVGGVLASISFVNILHLNCLSLIVAGSLTAVLSMFTSFNFLLFYAISFGFFVAFFIPLTPMFLVKYLGLENLTNSFGMLCLIKGVATMIGPPIAGSLYQHYDSYNETFYFGGSMFILAGISFYSLAFTNRSLKLLAKECTCIIRNGGVEVD